MVEQVVDGYCEVMVRVHQPAVRGDDAVSIGVGIVAGRDLIVVAVGDERRHRIGRAAIHRILPSVSSVMNRHVASTSGLTTVRLIVSLGNGAQ